MKRNLAEELYRKSRTKGPIQTLIIIKMQRNFNQKNKFGIQSVLRIVKMRRQNLDEKISRFFGKTFLKNNMKKN